VQTPSLLADWAGERAVLVRHHELFVASNRDDGAHCFSSSFLRNRIRECVLDDDEVGSALGALAASDGEREVHPCVDRHGSGGA